ncbi:STAS domain-containing protein [Streptomyces sp. NPDC052013]|uniref:STAS domain-containing protein n=1 Tax=Streptomyces sp. NPDC052013 TaxID=3365679 RepID=UPI0037D7F659
MHAEDLLQIHTQRWGDEVLLHITGELDIATAPLVDTEVAACLAHPTRIVHADLSGLTFCDATGFQALQRMTRALHTAHAAFHLLDIHPQVRRTLTALHAPAPWSPLT